MERIDCYVVLCASLLLLAGCEPAAEALSVAPRIVDAGTIVAAPVPAPAPAPAPLPVPVPAPVDELDKAPAATTEILVSGPAAITWKGLSANKQGDGKVMVRASATSITATDARRGSTHLVPIVHGVADFDALPRGELVVRAVPQAALFLANESIGTTPPAKSVSLPVGDYTVKLVFQDKVKTARVKVTADAKAEIRMKMTE